MYCTLKDKVMRRVDNSSLNSVHEHCELVRAYFSDLSLINAISFLLRIFAKSDQATVPFSNQGCP